MRKRIKYILLIIAALSLVELLFNASILFDSNREGVRFNMPVFAVENDEGNICVVDVDWTNMTILNPDHSIRATIQSNHTSQNLPDLFSYVSMDERFIYITDRLLSDNGMYVKGERILKYNLDGEYLSTLYADTFETVAVSGKISSTTLYEGCLFMVKADGDSVNVECINLEDGKCSVCTRVAASVKDVYYQPEVKVLTYCTKDGRCFEYSNGESKRIMLSDTSASIARVVHTKDDSRFILDTKNNVLVRQDSDLTETVVCETSSNGLWLNSPTDEARHLFLCDEAKSVVTSIGINDGKAHTFSSAEWPTSHIFWWYLTLICILLLSLIVVYFVILFIIHGVKKSDDSDQMSPANLYGKPAFFIFISFIVTGLMFSISYYQARIDKAVSDMASIASSISEMSKGDPVNHSYSLGDAVKRVDSPDDYGNDDYNHIRFLCNSICAQNSDLGFFDVQFDVFRYDRQTDKVTYVYDHSMLNLVGAPLQMETVRSQGADTCVTKVLKGENTHFLFETGRGAGVLLVFSPIYDSEGDIVGYIQIVNDFDAISQHTIQDIMHILLRIFTMLSVVLMAFVELKLLFGIVRLRKERFAAAGHPVTICEGHRPMRVLGKIPFFIFVPFIAPYSKELAVESGIFGDPMMLAALPLSFNGFIATVASPFISMLTKRNPGRYQILSNLLYVLTAVIFLLNHLYFRNYYVVLALMGLIGFASILSNGSLKNIRFFDLKPDERFSKVIFTNMEPPIGAAIGAALGALLYDWVGIKGALIVLAVVGLLGALFSRLFIASDINISKADAARRVSANDNPKAKNNVKSYLRYLLSLEVLACMLCVCIPLGFIGQFTSYVLPMFNENLGYAVLVVGFLTLLTRLLPLMFSSSIVTALKDKRIEISFGICFAAIAAVLFLFALRQTIICFALTIIIIEVIFPILKTLIDKFQIGSAKRAGVNPSDMNGFFEITMSVGTFVGPLCFAALISVSYSAVGWISGLVCVACAVAMFFLSLKKG